MTSRIQVKFPGSSDKFFLIGLPGSGKSTIGKILAELLGVKCYDLDTEIESRTGQSIAEIFEEVGESRFREIEKSHLEGICAKDHPLVLSTGGGTPCFHGNIEFMNQVGKTIFLDSPISILVDRVSGRAHRPMFTTRDPESVLFELDQKRRSFYEQATIVIQSDQMSKEIAEIILARIQDPQ